VLGLKQTKGARGFCMHVRVVDAIDIRVTINSRTTAHIPSNPDPGPDPDPDPDPNPHEGAHALRQQRRQRDRHDHRGAAGRGGDAAQ